MGRQSPRDSTPLLKDLVRKNLIEHIVVKNVQSFKLSGIIVRAWGLPPLCRSRTPLRTSHCTLGTTDM
jgi:hypothetical protein